MHNIDENEVLRDALSGLNEDVPPMPEGLHAAWMQKVEEDMNDSRIEKTRTRKSITRFLSIAAAMVFVVGGTLLTRDELSSDALNMKSAPQENGAAMAIYGSRAYANDSYDYSSESLSNLNLSDSYFDGYAVEEAAEAEFTMDTGMVMMARGVTTTSTSVPAQAEKKIIRTASLTIATQTFEESLNALKAACEQQGGWIESSSENVNSYTGLRTAYLTLRVPQDSLDAYLAGADGLGRITNRSESAQDVTASYQDTRTRLDTQLALMERLQALITESGDLSDLLALESQIADTQYQIDSLQSSLNRTDRQVSYSTVDVTLREEKTVELTDTTVSLGERIVSAIQVGFGTLTDFLQDMVVFLVAAAPFIVIVVIAFILVKIIRKRRK